MPSSNYFDAIVVGSGISGGWAAKELTEKGLKTLLLERGRNVEHIKDYQGTEKDPWDLTHRNSLSQEDIKEVWKNPALLNEELINKLERR